MTMGWLEAARQAVVDSVSSLNFVSNPHSHDHSHDHTSRLWNSSGRSKLKSLVCASLLASASAGCEAGGTSASCPNAQLSCHNTTAVDTCCLNHPGGLMLQTQFWDTHPPVGPSDSWTIHGLWFAFPTMQTFASHLTLSQA